MDKRRFWTIIEKSEKTQDWEAQCHNLERRLGVLSVEEIIQFDKIFDDYWHKAYTWDLWGVAFLIGGGCSNDGFMDFRSWLISRGENVYKIGIENADKLAEIVEPRDGDCQFEKFQYVARLVWCDKTKKNLYEYPQSGSLFSEKPSGQLWDEKDLEERFPQVAKKFR